MRQQSGQQVHALVLLAQQRVAHLVCDAANAQGAHGIDEQRVAAIEGVDVAKAIGKAGPARRLHCAAHLEREFVEVQFPFVALNAPGQHQPPQISVGGDVVEAVIVHASVRQVLRHILRDMSPRQRQQLFIAA